MTQTLEELFSEYEKAFNKFDSTKALNIIQEVEKRGKNFWAEYEKFIDNYFKKNDLSNQVS